MSPRTMSMLALLLVSWICMALQTTGVTVQYEQPSVVRPPPLAYSNRSNHFYNCLHPLPIVPKVAYMITDTRYSHSYNILHPPRQVQMWNRRRICIQTWKRTPLLLLRPSPNQSIHPVDIVESPCQFPQPPRLLLMCLCHLLKLPVVDAQNRFQLFKLMLIPVPEYLVLESPVQSGFLTQNEKTET
ncbi:uncharacterized protein LACBIDRAFT_324449 [Laccaria bicolor S238N-H82]|uniref:Predicted protein n=1 Tax=Laccaria bicolor (strain S238N-H82 / ATCC MYA-4686) TaxID=486041 RepID=B0D1V0_LACBS|nr:uncharacterized protein LACBIDRAFT_324449 [Laccaria bicolor S238N-H82]EDR12052.1 predicted protein [Laccaria bicolor S238N-H82]|eukprot:XP_001877949.1 predicted protein [Laccaria bicolor S238N-H82]